jgi:hypothetical protein
MAEAKTKVTRETLVNVTMKGEVHTFTVGGGGSHSIESWANSLSDLTGYKRDFIVEKLVEGLTKRYSYVLPTSAGDLCPIRFLVTKA